MEEQTNLKVQQNIVIIGGGIIGCTSAYFLTHHPQFDPSVHSVTVIEAARLANAASGKAGGLLAAWAYPNKLAKLSFDLHDELALEHNGAELWGYRRVRCGQITAVAHDTHQSEVNQPEIDLGKYWRRISNNSSLLPKDLDWFDHSSAKSYDEFADTTSTAQLHPLKFTENLAKLAESKGARIIYGTVEHINCSNINDTSASSAPLAASDDLTQKKVVSVTYVDKITSQPFTIEASTVVLAAGPWSSALLPKIGMRPLRAHSVTIKLQRPVSPYCLFSDIQATSTSKPISLEIYGRPNNEVYICSRGDLGIPLPHPANAVEVSSDTCQDIINAAKSVSEELRKGQVTGRRACYLPVLDGSSNNDPVIGNSELEGLVLATGHSCWGISNAPGTGKAISELILEGRISCMDTATLELARTIR